MKAVTKLEDAYMTLGTSSVVRIYTIVFAMMLGSTVCTAQVHNDQLTSRLDVLFQARYASDSPGASVLIAKGGDVVYSQSFGMADLEHGIAVSENTRFAIGSITKQFTAAAVLLLAEQGHLALTDPVSVHLPSLSGEKGAITIEQLLTHASGLADYPRVTSIRQQLRNDLTPDDILEAVLAEPLDFSPGERISYSNSGYFLLGKVIEAVSGKSYAAFLNEHVFEPLQMTHTLVGDHRDIVTNRARGYSTGDNGEVIHATYHSSSYAAGAILSTPRDLNRWITGLRSGKILMAESLDAMFSNYTLANGLETGDGLGWERNMIGPFQTFEHSGFEPGYKANSVYIPEEQLYVVVLQNSEAGSPTPSMLKAAALAVGYPYPDASSAVALSDEASKALIGTYQLEDENTRIIGQTDAGYYYRAPGGQATPLYAIDKQTLVFPEGYRQLEFVADASGAVSGFVYRNRAITREAVKISADVPEENTEVALAVETLQRYVGAYELEAFVMNISLEDGKLFAQPEGSDKLPLVPKSERAFFIREIGAEIEFQVESEQAAIEILIEGQRMSGKRKAS